MPPSRSKRRNKSKKPKLVKNVDAKSARRQIHRGRNQRQKTPPKRIGKLFEDLVAVQARLRAPGGCPWDREQTHATLKTYLIEEAYEALHAYSGFRCCSCGDVSIYQALCDNGGHPPVVMDVVLKDDDGRGLCREFKKEYKRK